MVQSPCGNEAFIWDAANGMRNLQDVLTSDFGLGSSLTGWTLLDARGFSADGLTVVGTARNPSGNIEAFLARLEPAAVPTPIPEPSSLVLLGIGALSLCGYGWRRRRVPLAACPPVPTERFDVRL